MRAARRPPFRPKRMFLGDLKKYTSGKAKREVEGGEGVIIISQVPGKKEKSSGGRQNRRTFGYKTERNEQSTKKKCLPQNLVGEENGKKDLHSMGTSHVGYVRKFGVEP